MMTVSCPAHRTIFDAQDARLNPPEGPYASRKPFSGFWSPVDSTGVPTPDRDTQSVLADSCYRKSTRAMARFAHFLSVKKKSIRKDWPRRECPPERTPLPEMLLLEKENPTLADGSARMGHPAGSGVAERKSELWNSKLC